MKFKVCLFITLVTLPNCVVGVWTPTDRDALKTAVNSCLSETPDGSCPTFAASGVGGNSYGAMNEWDTSQVTDMSGMFQGAVAFNADISEWDTEQVTTMSYMFQDARAFNQPITFDIEQVMDMSGMFQGAGAFNNGGQPLAMNTTGMSINMFAGSAFVPWYNNGGQSLSHWKGYCSLYDGLVGCDAVQLEKIKQLYNAHPKKCLGFFK